MPIKPFKKLFKKKKYEVCTHNPFEFDDENTEKIAPATSSSPAQVLEHFTPQTDAEYLGSLTNNFCYDARNFDIISSPKGKTFYVKWAEQQEILHFMKSTNQNFDGTALTDKKLKKVQNNILQLEKWLEKEFGHKIYPIPNADFVFQVQDENGTLLRDNRNMISCGKENSYFASYWQTTPSRILQDDTQPTILQIDMENCNPPILVSATSAAAFEQGLLDAIETYIDYSKLGISKCIVHLIAGEKDCRQQYLDVCTSWQEILNFIENTSQKILNSQSNETKEDDDSPNPEDDLDKTI